MVSIGLLFTILFKKFEIATDMPHRTEKLVRDSEKFEIAKFEIARLFIRQRTVNAQGTETFVRNSEVFEIARVRDSEGRLYLDSSSHLRHTSVPFLFVVFLLGPTQLYDKHWNKFFWNQRADPRDGEQCKVDNNFEKDDNISNFFRHVSD